jgi:hypothetical protein
LQLRRDALVTLVFGCDAAGFRGLQKRLERGNALKGVNRASSLERSQMLEDCVVALFTARYRAEPQALELAVQCRQAVGLVMNVVLVDVFQAFPAQLHDEEQRAPFG